MRFFSTIKSGGALIPVFADLTETGCFFSVFSVVDEEVFCVLNLLPHCSQKLLDDGFFVPHFPQSLTSGINRLLDRQNDWAANSNSLGNWLTIPIVFVLCQQIDSSKRSCLFLAGPPKRKLIYRIIRLRQPIKLLNRHEDYFCCDTVYRKSVFRK